jgi:hypothetical protein
MAPTEATMKANFDAPFLLPALVGVGLIVLILGVLKKLEEKVDAGFQQVLAHFSS